MLGPIAAGLPLDVFDGGEAELLAADAFSSARPGDRLSLGRDLFALRVHGDSMIDDGIVDGDFVLIASSPTVAHGAIGVAMHQSANGDWTEATLKHVLIHADAVHLRSANPAYPDRVIPREEWDREWSVQGELVELRRRYGD
jgi:repressor LexA